MEDHTTQHGDMPDVHGMLVIGKETAFLSHLPMFDHPHHSYQVLLEVTFTKPGSNAHADYVSDRRSTGTKVYTLVPERFVLLDLVSTDPEKPARTSFKGTIFRGHFERGGKKIIENVEVNVTRVVHFRRFEPLTYMLFGKGQELFLAHLITKPPDFDQVLTVERVSGRLLADEELQHGVLVRFPGTTNTIANRLKPGQTVEGEVHIDGDHTHESAAIELRTGVELCFEEGELRSRATFRQTQEEQKAGF